MKPLVIYHANCADGFGAAFAAWLVLGDEAEYVPFNYADSSPDYLAGLCRDRDAYILDFSFKKLVMEHILKSAKRVVWLDHHKTAFEMWCGAYEKGMNYYPTELDALVVRLDDNKSGAYLAWEYFHPGKEVPQFIRHIDDYDRWVFAIDGTKAFNKAVWSYAPWSFKQWVEWFYDCEAGFNHKYWSDFYAEGDAILRAHDQNVVSVVKGSAREVTIPVASVPTMWEMVANGISANCPPHLTSDVGHELANQSGTFGLCWTLGQTGSIAKCSLRSNGDYDVSAIAKSFGGGGHRNAAGFEVDIQALLRWLK